jgi:hypothetical protein
MVLRINRATNKKRCGVRDTGKCRNEPPIHSWTPAMVEMRRYGVIVFSLPFLPNGTPFTCIQIDIMSVYARIERLMISLWCYAACFRCSCSFLLPLIIIIYACTSTFLTRSGREGIFPCFNAFSNKIKASIWVFKFAPSYTNCQMLTYAHKRKGKDTEGGQERGNLT